MSSEANAVGQASACHPQHYALVVAHRGVIRTITQRLAGVAPHSEIGSIQVLRADSVTGPWRAEMLDVTGHL